MHRNVDDRVKAWLATLVLAAIALYLPAAVAEPEAAASDDIAQLEADLLALMARIRVLEEDLLYPASSQVAVYLRLDVGELFDLDAVTVELNGDPVTHHLYTQRQRTALFNGGVQKLYIGNARQGSNELTAFFTGTGPGDRDYRRATSLTFEHGFEPVLVELVIADDVKKAQPTLTAQIL